MIVAVLTVFHYDFGGVHGCYGYVRSKRARRRLTTEPALLLIDYVQLRFQARRVVQLELVAQVERRLNHVANFDLLLFVVLADFHCFAVVLGRWMRLVFAQIRVPQQDSFVTVALLHVLERAGLDRRLRQVLADDVVTDRFLLSVLDYDLFRVAADSTERC